MRIGPALLVLLTGISGVADAAPRPGLQRGTEAAQSLTAGVLMLAGILLAGFGLLLFVVLWGHRTRRVVREPLPPTSPVDELWFLKRSPPASRDEPPAAAPAERPPDEE